MKFSECIDLAIANKKVSEAKGEEAKQAYQTAYDEERFRGQSERAADDLAAVKAVEALGKKTADEQWRKIHEIRQAAELYSTIINSENPAHEIRMLAYKMDATVRSINSEVHTNIENNLEKSRPRLGGVWQPIAHQEDIVHGMYGKGTTEGQLLAKELVKADDYLRVRANDEGANLPRNVKGLLPMRHERQAMNRYAHQVGKGVAKREWMEENMNRMDWELVERDGAPVPEHQREAFLAELYESITTSGALMRDPGQQFSMALAKRLSHPEFFYYKTAEDWLYMNKKYGMGDVYHQVMGTITARARDIAMLKHLGPNPEQMKVFLKNTADKRSAQLDSAKPGGPGKNVRDSFAYKTGEELDQFDKVYAMYSGSVPEAASILAMAGGTLRTLMGPTVLQFAFVSNLTDIGMAKTSFMFYKHPATGYISKFAKVFAAQYSAEGRKWLVRNLGAMESSVGVMMNEARYTGFFDGAQWSKRFADWFFRLSGMNVLTQAEKHVSQWQFMGDWADAVATKWEDLPWQDAFVRFGITKEEWDIFRATPIREPDGVHLLHPLDVLKRTDLDRMEARQIADKFWDFLHDVQARTAPTPSTRIEASLGRATNPNKVMGEIQREVGFIKRFGAMIFMTYLRDIWDLPDAKSRSMAIARFVTVLTLAGAVITQMKTVLKGNDPENMNPLQNLGFWGKSLLNGGSLGFAGDVIFGLMGQFQHGGLSEVLAGPEAQFVTQLLNLTIGDQFDLLQKAVTEGPERAFKEYKGGKDFVKFISKYAPVPWPVWLAWQRMIADDLLKQTDPAAYKALLRKQSERQNNGQGTWWGVGDDGPKRLPNLLSALGINTAR